MSLEKPWKTAFTDLVKEFSSHYQCEISSHDDSSMAECYLYPSLTIRNDGFHVSLDISEFPGNAKDARYAGSGDNIEFLQIKVYFTHDYEIQITRESFADRFAKFLHLKREFQTGNDDFDSRFFIKLSHEMDKDLLSDLKIQQVITDLDPFTFLSIKSPHILYSQEIKKEEQLTFLVVNACFLNVIRLSKFIRQKQ